VTTVMRGCATSSEVICVVVAQYPRLLSFHIQVVKETVLKV